MKNKFKFGVSLLLVLAIVLGSIVIAATADQPLPTVSIEKYNLSFRDNVYIKYAVRLENVDASALNADDLTMYYWTTDQTDYTVGTHASQNHCVGTQTIDGQVYYIFQYTDLAAKQMADVITCRASVRVNGTEYFSRPCSYSICKYAQRQLGLEEGFGGTENAELRELLISMLEYGAKAQKYFGYRVDCLATDILKAKVTFDPANGDASTVQMVNIGDPVSMPGAPVKPDHTFLGWYLGDTAYDFSTPVTKVLTLTAKWREPSVYSGKADTSWFTGDKTEYVLESADQLVGFQELRKQRKSFEGITIKLGVDVILNQGTIDDFGTSASGFQWALLNSTYLFKGTFDGQGHKIKGLYIKCTSSGIKGMFGGVGGNAVIQNLTIENAYVESSSSEGKTTLGTLIARVNEDGSNVLINNVHINAVMKHGTPVFNKTGGFLGEISAEDATVTFKNCSFNGSITMNGSCVGGFVGNFSPLESALIFENCQVNGSVSGIGEVGGFVGKAAHGGVIRDAASVFTGTLAGSGANEFCGFNGEEDLSPLATPAAGTESLRVMSFNIQTNIKSSTEAAAQNRMNAVTQEILRNNPTVLGVQEDPEWWVDHLKRTLTGYDSYASSDVLSGFERNSIYYKKGTKVLESGQHWLTANGKQEGAALTIADLNNQNGAFYMTDKEMEMLFLKRTDSDDVLLKKQTRYIDKDTGEEKTGNVGNYLTRRGMSYVVIEIGGRPLLYVNTHLTHRSPSNPWYNTAYAKLRSNERIREFDILQSHVQKITEKYEDILVFITGDMNDLEGTPIYNHATSMYLDSAKVAETYCGIAGTWNGAFDLSRQGDCYPSSREGTGSSRLDYCFISQTGFTVTRYKAGAGKATVKATDGSNKTIYTSDHLPIIVDLNFAVPVPISVPKAPESKVYTVNDFSKTMPERFSGEGVIHVAASEIESNSEIVTKNANKQYVLLAKAGIASDVSASSGVMKLINKGIYHYYLDSTIQKDGVELGLNNVWARWIVEVPEDGRYDMSLYLRLKANTDGGTGARKVTLQVDQYAPVTLSYDKITSAIAGLQDETDGSYLSGWSLNLTAGKHVFAFTLPTKGLSLHFRDFYFVKTGEMITEQVLALPNS